MINLLNYINKIIEKVIIEKVFNIKKIIFSYIQSKYKF